MLALYTCSYKSKISSSNTYFDVISIATCRPSCDIFILLNIQEKQQIMIIHDLYPVTLMTKVSKQTLTINSVSQSVHKLKTNIKLYGFICYLKVYKNNVYMLLQDFRKLVSSPDSIVQNSLVILANIPVTCSDIANQIPQFIN